MQHRRLRAKVEPPVRLVAIPDAQELEDAVLIGSDESAWASVSLPHTWNKTDKITGDVIFRGYSIRTPDPIGVTC